MFDATHYVPILKGKKGELDALKHLITGQAERLTPLVELPPIPTDWETETPGRSVQDHVSRFPPSLAKAWKERGRVFVDADSVDGQMTDGRHVIQYVVDEARALGVEAVPVIGLGQTPACLAAVSLLHSSYGCGCCLRLNIDDVSAPTVVADVDDLLRELDLGAGEVDLVVDAESVNGQRVAAVAAVLRVGVTSVPHVTDWRTFTVAAGAFPQSLSGVDAGTVGRLDRVDWLAWLALRGVRAALPRMPTFGDYTIDHPDFFAMDPRKMRVSASIRYTADLEWIIMRGRWLNRRGGIGYQQFPNLARALVALPEFCGAGFSWGDKYLDDCASGAVGTGSLTTWRTVGTNHHLVKATTQIASLGAP